MSFLWVSILERAGTQRAACRRMETDVTRSLPAPYTSYMVEIMQL